MPNYSVVGPSVNFSDGVLELSEEQYGARAHNLEDLGKGRYKIVNTVQFKHGEMVGYEGEVNKTLLSLIEEEGKKEPDDPDKDPLELLLEGNVGEVKKELPNLSDDDLLKVIELEEAGENRKGVLDAVNAVIESRDND